MAERDKGKSQSVVKAELVEFIEEDFKNNERKLRWRMWGFEFAAVLIAGEIAAWLITV